MAKSTPRVLSPKPDVEKSDQFVGERGDEGDVGDVGVPFALPFVLPLALDFPFLLPFACVGERPFVEFVRTALRLHSSLR